MHPALTYRDALDARAALAARFEQTRARTEALVAPLSPEDMQVQSMPDASPAKWHLAHTSWFFEHFVLGPHAPGYAVFDPGYGFLFNSYYEAVGARWKRAERGLLSRPCVADILAYRTHVTAAVAGLCARASSETWRVVAPLIELGVHHEQQHQELLLTDIKHMLSLAPEPFAPWAAEPLPAPRIVPPTVFHACEGGLLGMGSDGERFIFDNEWPRHQVFLYPFELANRCVTNREWRAFVEDGGYQDPALWLADGWDWVQRTGVRAPLYWRETDEGWTEYTLHGLAPLRDDLPVCHVSAYEAHAYAEWIGARLPTEFELEAAATLSPAPGDLLFASPIRHPAPAEPSGAMQALEGGVWE